KSAALIGQSDQTIWPRFVWRAPNRIRPSPGTVACMQEERSLVVARISAEASAAAHLDDVCRWLIETQGTPVRLGVDDVPALGQVSWLKLGRPIVAPRAVLCALWLLDGIDAGISLLAGQLR